MVTIPVWLRDKQPDGFLVTAFGMPACQAVGKTPQDVLDEVQHQLTDALQNSDFELDVITSDDPDHPLLAVAGMFANDSQFDDMLAFMEADRRELDARMAACDYGIDLSDSAT
jgi:hypothetical protein